MTLATQFTRFPRAKVQKLTQWHLSLGTGHEKCASKCACASADPPRMHTNMSSKYQEREKERERERERDADAHLDVT